jgi:ABC-type microcin C transport system duplicated ATPase subunit YejF
VPVSTEAGALSALSAANKSFIAGNHVRISFGHAGIVKDFNGVKALDGIDLKVRAGEIVGCAARTAQASRH